jgi:hypothetical protein
VAVNLESVARIDHFADFSVGISNFKSHSSRIGLCSVPETVVDTQFLSIKK